MSDSNIAAAVRRLTAANLSVHKDSQVRDDATTTALAACTELTIAVGFYSVQGQKKALRQAAETAHELATLLDALILSETP